ncbi:MAG: hypothetical protein Q9222_001012 [Ikaeria aurantiellina]
MSGSLENGDCTQQEPIHEDSPGSSPFGDSAAYADQGVTEDLHPAFAETGITFNRNNDCFVAQYEDTSEEVVLSASQKAFTDALECFQRDVKPKYKSKVDLRANNTWSEVIQYADEARKQYTGVGRKGIIKKIHHGLRIFQTAAPAVQAWLKLLPSTSTYGSVVCGVDHPQAAVRLRQLREETLHALDQIPRCIEKAQFFMQTYGSSQINQQVGNLYLAIVDGLQHILEWYKRAAGLRYLASAVKGPAYAETLRRKMMNVETAAQTMSDHADERKQVRLKDIWDASVHTKDQVDQLKIIATEARNHLYAVLKDTEIYQDILQSGYIHHPLETSDAHHTKVGKNLEQRKQAGKRLGHTKQHRSRRVLEEENMTARKSLLAEFGPKYHDPSQDVENALNHVASMTLVDQDRVGVLIEHPAVQEWMLNPSFGGLLVHGNGRRHDPISPTSVGCALLIHVFLKKLRFPTLYWFCGLNSSGRQADPLDMLRSLICQLICLSCCKCKSEDRGDLDTHDLEKLLQLFKILLRRSSDRLPFVCILDGLSFYESARQSDITGKIVSTLAGLATSEPSILMLLLTSPIRSQYISRQRKIAERVTISELPDHVSGTLQGLNGPDIIAQTEGLGWALSESLPNRRSTV